MLPAGEPEITEEEEPIRFEDVNVLIVPKGFTGQLGTFGEEDESIISEDSVKTVLDAKIGTDTPEGYLKFNQITIAREMVQDYNNVKVFKPGNELEAILDHGENRHVTDEHPDIGYVTSRSERKGYIENLTFTDTHELKADLIITDRTLGDTIRSGNKREVSIGFYADKDTTAGIFGDVAYTESQINLLLDHVAITKDGRCSRKDGCGIKGDSRNVKVRSVVPQVAITDVQIAQLRKADKIIADHRIELIAQISSVRDIDRNVLDAMNMDELERSAILIKPDIVQSQGFGMAPEQSIRAKTDAAYARIGSDK